MTGAGRKVQPHLFIVEHQLTGQPIPDELGTLTHDLCNRLFITVRNRLVTTPSGRRLARAGSILGAEERIDFATLTFNLQGEGSPPAASLSRYSGNDASKLRGRRPQPIRFASYCLHAVRGVLENGGFYRYEGEGEMGTFTSGPEPITGQELRERVASLAMLREELPAHARDFALDAREVCTTIFDSVTGGELPRVACEVGYTGFRQVYENSRH